MLFKVWDAYRKNKILVNVNEASGISLYDNLILKASEKLNINGCRLVLETDGSCVDAEDEVLKEISKETLILLQPTEEWMCQHQEELDSTISLASSKSGFSEISSGAISDFAEQMNDGKQNTFQLTNENNWLQFHIPWERMGPSILNMLECNKKDFRTVTQVVHIVADAMNEEFKIIPNKAIRIVANKMISKYPKIFTDTDDDGTIMGTDGAMIIYCKLKDRLKYLSRNLKRNNASDGNEHAVIPLKLRRKILSAKAGCSNWQPTSPKGDIEDYKNKLKEMANGFEFDEEIETMMESTYSAQRQFINAQPPPTLDCIREEWPILLTNKGVIWHFNKLMAKSVSILGDNLLKKSEKIIEFGLMKKMIPFKPIGENDIILNLLKIATIFFSENISLLYNEIKNEADCQDFNFCSPSMVQFKKGLYNVVFERKIVGDAYISVRHALEHMFALYYNFNLQYPRQAAHTCELIQRYFLKIVPEQGTKSPKSSQLKLVSFLTKLRDM